jgi:nucleotide-binding universal stress UspA family protein
VVAALDTTPAARAVLETALGIGHLTGASVGAVHVRDGPVETPEWLAGRDQVPLRILEGPVTDALLDAVADPDVIAAVFGARATPGGRRPVGRTALHVLERTSKPIVVVPPEAFGVSPRPFRRLLVPLEGSENSSRPVADSLYPLIVAEVELVVLHVFTNATVPRILDRPYRDLALWGDEFLARFCPVATRIELRSGSVGGHVAEVCAEENTDLVVLSWSQVSSAGRAAVIRDVLGHSTIPVLLLPVHTASADHVDDGAPPANG